MPNLCQAFKGTFLCSTAKPKCKSPATQLPSAIKNAKYIIITTPNTSNPTSRPAARPSSSATVRCQTKKLTSVHGMLPTIIPIPKVVVILLLLIPIKPLLFCSCEGLLLASDSTGSGLW